MQTTTDVQPVVIGKPFPPMFDAALGSAGRDRAVMIGDSPKTDIEGARRAGIASALISNQGDKDPNADLPDAVLPDLTALFDPGVHLLERHEEASK